MQHGGVVVCCNLVVWWHSVLTSHGGMWHGGVVVCCTLVVWWHGVMMIWCSDITRWHAAWRCGGLATLQQARIRLGRAPIDPTPSTNQALQQMGHTSRSRCGQQRLPASIFIRIFIISVISLSARRRVTRVRLIYLPMPPLSVWY